MDTHFVFLCPWAAWHLPLVALDRLLKSTGVFLVRFGSYVYLAQGRYILTSAGLAACCDI